jgi:hypothetical protein
VSKPSVFIASSVEGLPVAESINSNLDHISYPTMWPTGTFKLGSTTIDSLVKKSSDVDFAVFVFTPDDVTTIRKETQPVVRDNVLFELGLFIGALGKERCYIVRPRGSEMHLPSDLLGVTAADYEAGRPDGDLGSALNHACKQIKDRIAELGPVDRTTKVQAVDSARPPAVANPATYKLSRVDVRVLGECVDAHVRSPEGIAFSVITNSVKERGLSDGALALSVIKLEKLGYVERSVQTDRDWTYFAYSATPSGLDAMLQREADILVRPAPRTSELRAKANQFDDMDDDIPF